VAPCLTRSNFGGKIGQLKEKSKLVDVPDFFNSSPLLSFGARSVIVEDRRHGRSVCHQQLVS